MREYLDFALRIEEDYTVEVSSPAGSAQGRLGLDLGAPAVQNALKRLEEGNTDAALLEDFGGMLFESLFKGVVRDAFMRSWGQVSGQEAGLRLRLEIAAPLAALPWEYLYHRQRDTFLATSPETLLSRFIPVPEPLPSAPVEPPLKIIVVISGPGDLKTLDADEEERWIRSALKDLTESHRAQMKVLRMATRREIRAHLESEGYHVFHFIGHGDFRDERGSLALVREEDGRADWMDEEDFREFFLGYRTVRLVVLNACLGAKTSAREALVGAAPRLVQRGVPAVVAMRYEVPDDTAILFSREFYGSLAEGQPVDLAISTARRAILQDMGRDLRDFGLPVLFMRARDGVILRFRSPADELADFLKTFATRHREFGEWKAMHHHLQSFERNFDLVHKGVRGKGPASIKLYFPLLEEGWAQCEWYLDGEVAPFSETVECIGKDWWEQLDGARKRIREAMAGVRARLGEDGLEVNYAPLYDSVSHMYHNCLHKYLSLANDRLLEAKKELDELGRKLEGALREVNEGRAPPRFLERVRLEMQECLETRNGILCHLDQHNAVHRLLAGLAPLYATVVPYRDTTEPGPDIRYAIENMWRDYVSRTVEPSLDALRQGTGDWEKWVVEMSQKKNQIDGAITEFSPGSLRERIDSWQKAVSQKLLQTDRALWTLSEELGDRFRLLQRGLIR